ncbi:MAG: signal peptidase II [Synergistaceae bacterium]|nr:signal peptidase II [Synergistaceae bacterium]
MDEEKKGSDGRPMILRVCVFAGALTLDRVTKIWALSNLAQALAGESPVFPSLVLYFNRGITFSLFDKRASVALYAALTGAILFGIVCLKSESFRKLSGTSLLWAGAVGNLTDRIIYGYVIDWIFVGGYVNLADIWLSVGCLQIFAHCFQNFKREAGV